MMYPQKVVDSSGRKYNEAWKKQFKWLTLKDGSAYCVKCMCYFSTFRKHNLQVHEKTKFHKTSAAKKFGNVKKKSKGQLIITPEVVKECEIKLCALIACHSSIREVNHLSEIITLFDYGEASNIKLHRTKCANIIRNVITVSILEEIIEDLADSKYSLIIECSDIMPTKCLCICIKYFSKQLESFRNEFIGLVPVISLADDHIFNAISSYLQNCNFDLKNCVAFSSDGLDISKINIFFLSVISRTSPDIIFGKCFSHEFDLCYEKAFKKLPSNVEFLIMELTRWFKFSPLKKEFLTLFSAMNAGIIKPKRSITPNNTRWLVLGKCISAIVSHWSELKGYFNIICDEDENYHAHLILKMLNNEKNYLYLTFILPIIQDFENIHTSLQTINSDIIKVSKDLDQLHKLLLRKIYKRSDRRNKTTSIKNFTLGAKHEKELGKCNLSETDRKEITEKYFDFLVEANTQLENQLNKTLFNILHLKNFHPKEFLKPTNSFKVISKYFENIASCNGNFSILEDQHNKMTQINWENEFPNGEIPSDAIKFWVYVKAYEDSEGRKLFTHLVDTIFSAITIPFSRKIVEFVFSHMSDIKNNMKNKTSIQTLEAILRIRTFLFMQDKCCKDITVTSKMRSLFNKKMYEKHTSDIVDESLELILPSTAALPNKSFDSNSSIPSTSNFKITHTVFSDLSMPLISYTNEDSSSQEDLKVIYAML